MTGTPFSEIYPVDLMWLWQDKIVEGDVTILIGDSGIGKGYLVSEIVANVTTGGNLPGDAYDRWPAEVVLISLEDQSDVTTVQRLTAAGADLTKVHDLSEVDTKSDYSDIQRAKFDIQRDTPELKRLLKERGSRVRLVVIDPLTAATTRSLAGNLAARDTMQKLQSVAEEFGVAILVIHHPVKGRSRSTGNGLSIKDRAGGSKGLTDAARLVLGVERDPESDERLLTVVKSNICRDDAPPLRYRMCEPWPATHVEWVPGLEYADDDGVSIPPEKGTEAYKVFDALVEWGAPASGPEIAELSDVKYATVRSSLARFVAAGIVIQVGYGVYAPAQMEPPAQVKGGFSNTDSCNSDATDATGQAGYPRRLDTT